MRRKMSFGSLIINKTLLVNPSKRHILFFLGLTSMLCFLVPIKAVAWDCELAEGVWQRSISGGARCGYKYENVNVIANNGNVTIQPTPIGQCIPSGHCSCLDDNNKPFNGPVSSSRYSHPGAQISCGQLTKNFNISSDRLKMNSADGSEAWVKTSSSSSVSKNSRLNPSASTPYGNGTPYGTSIANGSNLGEDSVSSDSQSSTDNEAQNMSQCLEVIQSNSITSFKNNCNQEVAYTFCAADSKNPALKCKARYSTVIGQDNYGKGGGMVSAGGITYITPDHGESIRWFACETPATPYLTSYNPPKGVCHQFHSR
ncbi:MAG: hypothetical protein V9G21_03135 [Methylotenera sp.]